MVVLEYRYDGAKRTTFGSSFWNNEEQAGSDCHVATSPRRDVGSTTQKSTIQHVATSPRRDVTTSRRQLKNLHLIIKCQTGRNRGHREAYEERHGIPEPEDPDFERVPGICTAFHFF